MFSIAQNTVKSITVSKTISANEFNYDICINKNVWILTVMD